MDEHEHQTLKQELLQKFDAAYSNTSTSSTDGANANPYGVRWDELKELLNDFNGTSMQKLAAIERFVATIFHDTYIFQCPTGGSCCFLCPEKLYISTIFLKISKKCIH